MVSASFARDGVIYAEDERADHIYQVTSGLVRTCRSLRNGRRHVAAFYLPGEFFGLDARERRLFVAEAVVDSMILIGRRDDVMRTAYSDGEAAMQLWSCTAQELSAARDRNLLLAMTAPARMASFLLDMASRTDAGCEITLPMARQDIADYLGLTVETVSRVLTQFDRARTIAIATSKRITIRDLSALKRLLA